MEDKLNPDRVEEAIKNLNPDTALYQNLIGVLKTPDSNAEPEGGLARAVLDKLPAPEEVDVADRQDLKMRTTRGRERDDSCSIVTWIDRSSKMHQTRQTSYKKPSRLVPALSSCDLQNPHRLGLT